MSASMSRRRLFALPVALPVMAVTAVTAPSAPAAPFLVGAHFSSGAEYYRIVAEVREALAQIDIGARGEDNYSGEGPSC